MLTKILLLLSLLLSSAALADSYQFDPTRFAYGTSTRTITASTTKAGAVYVCEKAGNIHDIGTTFSAVSGSPTVDLRIETVSSFLPTGTLFGTNTNASLSPTANTQTWTTLTADAAVNAGDVIAVVVSYTSGTSATSVYAAKNLEQQVWASPYSVVMASGSWAIDSHTPMICVRYTDGTIMGGSVPAGQVTSTQYGSGSSPNERANSFTPTQTAPLRGCAFVANFQAGSACEVDLYTGTSTTATASITYGANKMQVNLDALHRVYFASPPTLTAGQEYRLSVKATTATSFTVRRYVFRSTTERDFTNGAMTSDTRSGGSWLGVGTLTTEMIYPITGTGTISTAGAPEISSGSGVLSP